MLSFQFCLVRIWWEWIYVKYDMNISGKVDISIQRFGHFEPHRVRFLLLLDEMQQCLTTDAETLQNEWNEPPAHAWQGICWVQNPVAALSWHHLSMHSWRLMSTWHDKLCLLFLSPCFGQWDPCFVLVTWDHSYSQFVHSHSRSQQVMGELDRCLWCFLWEMRCRNGKTLHEKSKFQKARGPTEECCRVSGYVGLRCDLSHRHLDLICVPSGSLSHRPPKSTSVRCIVLLFPIPLCKRNWDVEHGWTMY